MFRKLVQILSIAALAAALNASALALEPVRGWVLNEPGTPGEASSDFTAKPRAQDPKGCIDTCLCPDEGLGCTFEICAPPSGECTHQLAPGFCVIDDACVPEGTPSPSNPCVACNPSTSTSEYTPREGPCNDYDECTTEDQCVDGYCVGAPVTCDDYDKCTVDECDPSTGCGSTPKDCSDGLSCNVDSCDPATGACLHSKTASRLAYNGPSVAQRGRPIVLTALLTENGSTPVGAGRTVTFRVVTQICVGTTNSSGVAKCTLVISQSQTPGAKSVQLSFAGDGCYLAASKSGTLWVQ